MFLLQAAMLLILTSQNVGASDVVTDKLKPVIDRLCSKGNNWEAFKLLSKLEPDLESETGHLWRLKLTVASQLMYVDGRVNREVDPEIDGEAIVTASHPIFPTRTQDLADVRKKLEHAEQLFLETLQTKPGMRVQFTRYYSNHVLSVTTTLANQLKLIETARNPALKY